MAVSTLRAVRTEARAISVPALALAAGNPSGNAILALDLGQKTGWAVRNTDGAIASGTVEFKPGRFEGGGMIYLRFRAWLQEVDETAGGIGAVYFEEVRFHRGVTAAHAYGGYLAHLTALGGDVQNPVPRRAGRDDQTPRHRPGQRRQGRRDRRGPRARLRPSR
jgi:hypothetical protein